MNIDLVIKSKYMKIRNKILKFNALHTKLQNSSIDMYRRTKHKFKTQIELQHSSLISSSSFEQLPHIVGIKYLLWKQTKNQNNLNYN